MPLTVDTHKFAVSQVANDQFILSEHHDEGCAPLVKFFYNLSLTVFENFSNDVCTLKKGSFWVSEKIRMPGKPGGQLCCEIVNRLRIAMSVKEREDGEVLAREHEALNKERVTRSRLSFLCPMLVKIVEVSL